MVERPGLAKHLRKLSDSHWDTGMKVVKKYIERGGLATDFVYKDNSFHIASSVSVTFFILNRLLVN